MLDVTNSPYREIAAANCNTGLHDCHWYHGSWHVLKALDLVSTSAIHREALMDLLRAAIGTLSRPRILLTGSTDETLLQLAHTVCEQAGVDAEYHALDICATPLAFMDQYASSVHLPLATYHTGILAFQPAQVFDVIITHAFMGNFSSRQRPALVSKWHDLLTERGKLVTIQRVRPSDTPARVGFTAEEARAFVSRALAAARQRGVKSASELAVIETDATAFADNFVAHAITSREELEDLFTGAGMEFLSLQYQSLEPLNGLSGPSVPTDAEFAHLIATRQQGKP